VKITVAFLFAILVTWKFNNIFTI